MKKTIIITDLDGTLLHPATYSFVEALPALGLIEDRRIPLVLCSSKTRAEIDVYRQRLHNTHPFIAENGGGIFIPHGYFSQPVTAAQLDGYQVVVLGMPYAEIRQRFVELRDQFGAKVRGFGDMSVAEIAVLTGLPPEEAALARQRDFDEPFIFDGEPDEGFLQAIETAGLRWTRGQFFHIMGAHDKGRAVQLLKALYEQESGAVDTIGLGDGLNDLPLLSAVEQPVLVRHEDGSYETRIELPGMLKTRRAGPAGWNETMLELLSYPDGAGSQRKTLLGIFNAALTAADPYRAILASVRIDGDMLHAGDGCYPLEQYRRIVVLGAGKSAARMALAIEHLLGKRISEGIVVTKYGHGLHPGIILQEEAAHPVPDMAGMAATQRILELAQSADEHTLVICLLSGGASALLVAPADGVTLQDKQEMTSLLLKAGASIGEVNAVRKHLSAVKGGHLAEAIAPARLLTLIMSDVIGDHVDVIASGPTAADDSSYADALVVLAKYRLEQKAPARALEHLKQGLAGNVAETVKHDAACLTNTRNLIVAGLDQALHAAAARANELGYTTEIVSNALQGEARSAAHQIAERARSLLTALAPGERRCLIYGGETTVTVQGRGKGGRNQELALAFALETEGLSGITLLSAGTDGSDGPTDAAGAVVDGSTAAHARSLGIDPAHYLNDNDSYTFFERYDAHSGSASHYLSGPTGTNVMDIQIVLLHGTEQPR